jgi:cytochrome c oxidase assembly protein subunit 11
MNPSNNKTLKRKLIVITCCMFGFGFALVPFYEKICQVTGINNIARADTVAGNSQVDASRSLTVEFDANLRDGLPWLFRPSQKSVTVHPGELMQVMYEITNNSNAPITGQAIPSYAPQLAALYFKKLECFCFTQQEFKPQETRKMPVVFVVGHDLPKDVTTITLSYTFFVVEGSTKKPG